MAWYREREDAAQSLIESWLGLNPTPEDRALVKRLDKQIRGNEQRALFTRHCAGWNLPDRIEGVKIHGSLPPLAESLFLTRFQELWPDWARFCERAA
jgi:hypothetical protein